MSKEKICREDLSVERNPASGVILIATVVDGHRKKMQYFGATEEEAIADFLDEVNGG